MPLPPYIAARRAPDERDRADYQTMFARAEGSVAAPTAGLHFTDALVARLAARGIALHKVTLHVGAGTFLPVKAEDTVEHRMHAEVRQRQRRDGGTRSTRCGARAAASSRSARPRCGCSKARAARTASIRPFAGETALFITPGYRFRAVDVMLTNFHLPRSTLFMLVAAFCGLDVMQRAYAHAIAARLSVLFLRRCLPAVPRRGLIPPRGHARPLLLPSHRHRRRRAPRRDRDAAWRGCDAGLHAGRHAGDGQGADSRRGARSRRRHRARQHLSPDAAARAPSASRRSAACTGS